MNAMSRLRVRFHRYQTAGDALVIDRCVCLEAGDFAWHSTPLRRPDGTGISASLALLPLPLLQAARSTDVHSRVGIHVQLPCAVRLRRSESRSDAALGPGGCPAPL